MMGESTRRPMGPPKLTPEQRARALEKAAEARRRRAEAKELLKSGSLTLPQLFICLLFFKEQIDVPVGCW